MHLTFYLFFPRVAIEVLVIIPAAQNRHGCFLQHSASSHGRKPALEVCNAELSRTDYLIAAKQINIKQRNWTLNHFNRWLLCHPHMWTARYYITNIPTCRVIPDLGTHVTTCGSQLGTASTDSCDVTNQCPHTLNKQTICSHALSEVFQLLMRLSTTYKLLAFQNDHEPNRCCTFYDHYHNRKVYTLGRYIQRLTGFRALCESLLRKSTLCMYMKLNCLNRQISGFVWRREVNGV